MTKRMRSWKVTATLVGGKQKVVYVTAIDRDAAKVAADRRLGGVKVRKLTAVPRNSE